MNPLKTFFGTLSATDANVIQKAPESLFGISINNLQGKSGDLKDFKGKKILFVKK